MNMIGIQHQQGQGSQQAAAGHGKSTSSQQHQHQLPQLSQHCQNMSLAGTSPARPVSSASSSASSPSPTHIASNHQQLHTRQPHKTSSRRVSSPGYHSAASSPGSSSVASPVSSSSSSGVSSVASSSCNRASGAHNHNHHHHHNHHNQQHRPQSPHQTIVSCTTASVSHGGFLPHRAIDSPPSSVVSKSEQQEDGTQRGSAPASCGNQTNLLDHFPELEHDGLRLSWFHNANNRQTLDHALASSKLIVAGDISLAEMSRYPVPIMARPPLGVSDLTLETWLSEVIQSRKGIKLTFTSTRTVEPAFRVLARHAQNLKGPLILSADILARPSGQQQTQKQQEQQPVDAWTFLMLCRTRFPRSIISIGWCAAQLAGPGSCVQPADSSTATATTTTSGPDSIFELDMMSMDRHQAPPVVSQPHHFSQPILHLSSAPSSQQQRLSSLNVVQQLAAVAAAAASNNGGHHNQQHFILSSNGSLNSSSGNSSGSPSPTSPISHLMRHHNSHVQQQQQQQRHSSQVAGGWPAMAAAAMVAANSLRQRCQDEDEGEEDEDQLPLNLNINEADPQHATPQGALKELAQKIHSLQQQSSNLNTLTSSLTSHNNQSRWEHIRKKAALAHRLNADSPSPVSTSPKQQQHAHHHHHHHYNNHQTTGGNLLCVKAPNSLHHHHHHHSLANLALATAQNHSSPLRHAVGQASTRQQHNQVVRDAGLGYTHEMIDKMASLVKEYNLTQAITFPVEARLMLRDNSLAELQRLLYQVGAHSTLTIVAQQEDLISVDDLLLIRKHFAAQQLMFDLPDELAASLRRELDR